MTQEISRTAKIDYFTGMNGVWWGLLHMVGTAVLWQWFERFLAEKRYLYLPTDGTAVLHIEAKDAALLTLLVVGLMVLVPFRKRSYFRALCNILSPAGLFLLIRLFPNWPVLVCLMLAYALIYWLLSLIQIVLTDLEPIPFSRRLKTKVRWSCTELVRIASGGLAAIAVFSAVALITPAARLLDPAERQGETYDVVAQNPVVAILKPEEVLPSLQPEARQNLTEEALTDLCQSVVNLQQQTLGIPDRAIVVLDDLPPHTLGQYCHQTRTIELDLSYVLTAEAEDLTETLCHEAYHLYENCLADAYNQLPAEYRSLTAFQEAAVYAEHREQYVSGWEDFDAYYESPLELGARTYAQKQVRIYQILAES